MAASPCSRKNGTRAKRGLIGLQPGRVHLERYSGTWAVSFLRERRRLARCLAGHDVQIEHIGSTAVPGLVAKPIIDVAVRLPSLRCLPQVRALLESLGYQYKGEFGLRGRHFFTKGNPVTHHVHVVSRVSKHWARWLTFRNYLRAHPEHARRYARLKQRLARRYAHNRDAYTKAKTAFVAKLLRMASKEQSKKTKIHS